MIALHAAITQVIDATFEGDGDLLLDRVNDLLCVASGKAPAARRPAVPGAERWLTPDQARARPCQLWRARAGSGKVVSVQLTGPRRPRRTLQRAWFGLNLATGRQVQVVALLQGSRRDMTRSKAEGAHAPR